MRRRGLEQALEVVPDFPDPQADREQYRTPAPVAADLLWQAAADGCITGRHVLDLGCGTGMFCLGAALLGAATVHGVDSDAAALGLARATLSDVDGARRKTVFDVADVGTWTPYRRFDTVLMNPPFGAQHGNRGADRAFYAKALEAVADPPTADDPDPQTGARGPGPTVWFLAQPNSERFLAAWASDHDATVERVAVWDYPIEARFSFHDAAVRRFEVAGYRMAPVRS